VFSKRWTAVVTAITAATLVAGCGSSSNKSSSGSTASSTAKSFSVALMLPGTLGDLGFFDSAANGMKKAESELGATTKTVEGGANNTSAWLSNLQALSRGNYDVVVTGSANDVDQLTSVAKQYPNQKYVVFDTTVNLPNVASATFRQNDGAFLSGVLAALASEDTTAFPLSGGHKNVGFVGGMNLPVIQDFAVGFKKGAQAVDPNIKVQESYVGNFTDSQAGYNQASSMYAAGADVVFAAAGGAGLGVLKASADKKRYSIGVDSNQNSLYPKNVLGSDLKNVDTAILDVLKRYKEGTLTFGKTYVYGISNSGVSLALNDALVPAAASAKIKDYSDQVSTGKINVPCVEPFCAQASQ
jgi:basic membrane protein A